MTKLKILVLMLATILLSSPLSVHAVSIHDNPPPTAIRDASRLAIPLGESEQQVVDLVFVGSNKPSDSTDGVVYGACGTAYIWLEKASTLQARIRWGANSTQGAILTAFYDWDLERVGGSELYTSSNTDLVFSTSYANSAYVNVGSAGWYKATLAQLEVVLVNGGRCVGMRPTETAYID